MTCLPDSTWLPSTSLVILSMTPMSKLYGSALNPLARKAYVPKLEAELVMDAYPPDWQTTPS